MEKNIERNPYIEELKKCIGKQIKIETPEGTIIEGICKAINFQYLNVVVMTATEKIIIKNPKTITRKRENKFTNESKTENSTGVTNNGK